MPTQPRTPRTPLCELSPNIEVVSSLRAIMVLDIDIVTFLRGKASILLPVDLSSKTRQIQPPTKHEHALDDPEN
jgi:hypothetical protein